MTVAPDPKHPEKFAPVFERETAASKTGNKGPLKFQEGIAKVPDINGDFQRGAHVDTEGTPRGYQNVETFYKRAPDTMRERAHIGSASWIEAPQLLSDFVTGTKAGDQGSVVAGWERVFDSGGYQKRPSAVKVTG